MVEEQIQKMNIEEEIEAFLKQNGVDKRVSEKQFERIKTKIIKKRPALYRPTFKGCMAKSFGEIECKGSECIAHIFTRQYAPLTKNSNNYIKICKNHELYFNKRPFALWLKFIKDNYPKKFEYIFLQINIVEKELIEFKKFLENINL